MLEMKQRLGTTPTVALVHLLAHEAIFCAVFGRFESVGLLAEQSIAWLPMSESTPFLALEARGLDQLLRLADPDGEADIRLAVEGFLREGNVSRPSTRSFNLTMNTVPEGRSD